MGTLVTGRIGMFTQSIGCLYSLEFADSKTYGNSLPRMFELIAFGCVCYLPALIFDGVFAIFLIGNTSAIQWPIGCKCFVVCKNLNKKKKKLVDENDSAPESPAQVDSNVYAID